MEGEPDTTQCWNRITLPQNWDVRVAGGTGAGRILTLVRVAS